MLSKVGINQSLWIEKSRCKKPWIRIGDWLGLPDVDLRIRPQHNRRRTTSRNCYILANNRQAISVAICRSSHTAAGLQPCGLSRSIDDNGSTVGDDDEALINRESDATSNLDATRNIFIRKIACTTAITAHTLLQISPYKTEVRHWSRLEISCT